MLQLSPGEYFGLVRELADPNDSGTYYVQAKMRNARTDALLDTINLTNQGSGRFQAQWQVPSTTSDALYIAITTTVYTDSGYTTFSDTYSRESETYLVYPRIMHFGGGGGRWSYRRFEEILAAALAKMIAEMALLIAARKELTLAEIEAIIVANKPAIPVVDFLPIIEAIRGIKFPDQIPVDLRPVIDAIEKKPVTEIPKADYAEILSAIKNIKIKPDDVARIIDHPLPSPYEIIREMRKGRRFGGKAHGPYEIIREMRRKKT
jgi:hypothetical protein